MSLIRGKFRSSLDMEKIPDGADIAKVIELTNKALVHLEFLNKSLSIQSNFGGYVAEDVVFLAGETIRLSHYLGLVPKYRIILRQVGNGVITDVNNTPSDWNDKIISLKNNGAVEVTATIFIARE